MLDNIKPHTELIGLARLKGRNYITQSVRPLLVAEELNNGWQEKKRNKTTVVLTKLKRHGDWLEDRLWILLYRMNLSYLSGKSGQTILLSAKDADSPKNQIDVLVIDDEVAIAFECKSQLKVNKRPEFQEELAKFGKLQQRIAQEVNQQFNDGKKRRIVLAMLLHNVILSEPDIIRAGEQNITLLDEQDLAYYEQLVSHLGPAAKYQFFADLLPGKEIPGLEIKLPAIKSKMGKHICYSFSITPEYLLKIAFVSHRMKGKASDVDAYQRMINKNRLKKIRDYISDDGIFPTNIILNLEKPPQFSPSIKEENQDKTNGVLGLITLRSAYKSAWIIDGQHRLYAYSGHPKASKSLLSVTAFENLPPDKQAHFFTSINAEQKSVPQSLLRELYAELNWDAKDPSIRAVAIVSKAVQTLDTDLDSPFFRRIRKTDDSKDVSRCITLTSICQALEKPGLYISMQKKDNYDYGPLWAFDNSNASTLKRTIYILKHWFKAIVEENSEWWDLGSATGGGLSMSDGVTVCINVLRSVLQYLENNGKKLRHFSDKDLFENVEDYAIAFAAHLDSFDIDERRKFREYRGAQGQLRATKKCQQGMQNLLPDFDPPGLKEFIELESAQTNSKAVAIVSHLENVLRDTIVEELQSQFGEEENQWWPKIPIGIRISVGNRFEKDNRKLGNQQAYLEIGDFKPIVSDNWDIYEGLLANGKGSKSKRLQWFQDIAEIKKKVCGSPNAAPLPLEELLKIEEYQNWLDEKLRVIYEEEELDKAIVKAI